MIFLKSSDFFEKIKKTLAFNLSYLRERWVSIFSFLMALSFHILIVSIGTRQYLGSPAHPESANQTVQKLQDAIKKKNMRFVYIKDDPNLISKAKPHPDTPLSDKDRAGSSPDGGKGTSWDPYSEGSSPQREFPAYGIPSPPIRKNVPSRQEIQGTEARKMKPAETIKEEAKKIAGQKEEKGEGKKGISIDTANIQAPKGEEGKDLKESNPAENKETGVTGAKGISGQIGQMMVESLKGGYRNTNASRLNKGAVSFETSGWDLGPYARIVQQKVESNWRIPAVQEILRQKGWVAVHFEIMKDGTIQNVSIEKSSRIPSYDQAALNALKSSSPLPPLPSFVTEEKISGTFRFFYNMWSENDE